jgi:hypothetical protein
LQFPHFSGLRHNAVAICHGMNTYKHSVPLCTIHLHLEPKIRLSGNNSDPSTAAFLVMYIKLILKRHLIYDSARKAYNQRSRTRTILSQVKYSLKPFYNPGFTAKTDSLFYPSYRVICGVHGRGTGKEGIVVLNPTRNTVLSYLQYKCRYQYAEE